MKLLIGKMTVDPAAWVSTPAGLLLPPAPEPAIVVVKSLILPPASLLVWPTPEQTYGVSKMKAAFEALVRAEAAQKAADEMLLGFPICPIEPTAEDQEMLALLASLNGLIFDLLCGPAPQPAPRRRPYVHKPRRLTGWLRPEDN
jgi:hypothetical protein